MEDVAGNRLSLSRIQALQATLTAIVCRDNRCCPPPRLSHRLSRSRRSGTGPKPASLRVVVVVVVVGRYFVSVTGTEFRFHRSPGNFRMTDLRRNAPNLDPTTARRFSCSLVPAATTTFERGERSRAAVRLPRPGARRNTCPELRTWNRIWRGYVASVHVSRFKIYPKKRVYPLGFRPVEKFLPPLESLENLLVTVTTS